MQDLAALWYRSQPPRQECGTLSLSECHCKDSVKNYLLTSKVFPVEDDHFHISVTAAAADTPRLGIISRHHDCTSVDEVETFLDLLTDQVREAVEAIGGRVVTSGRPPLE